ncbi:MAG: HypC/HybG/HupF family hydrogenase formation chaperone [Candidatus Dadabacteria bacterium]|nr:HypC/HybG/HupF family hydrogenase formation chaperone [Candidatus Dadabacteria bacterium]NIS08453.1 HypC/HybG/HupF family hydrogenase formation chaperone [Candidatus Dadabacteria bacterium]NIY21941.1 HypC/HybG/HupF family hydrogenase formation chaperone [Candidatus Dadabacteria bacterium]
MCLAIPGKIVGITDNDPITRRGKVSFGGLVKEVNLSFVPEADVDNYVMVHVGFAISRVDEKEADQVFKYLREMDELSELEDSEL